MSVPTVFGRYQLLEPLAKGGMAEVFKARLGGAAGTEKLVCIKRILPHLSRNHDFLALFVKEARIALPLTHGNITQVFDFGEEEGIYYLAMEYIAGRNLHEVLDRVREGGAKLDIAASLFVGAEVCKGLQYAHSFVDPHGQRQAVVHRDVTPQNILISFNGEVKLTDFGIALAATKVPGGEDGVVRGKACYLSPEQVEGNPGVPASDIFSLGSVLYEMLTGVRIFQAEDELATLARVRQAAVDPPSRHNPEIDEELDALVLKALARDPEQRYAKAGDLQVALATQLHKRAPGFTADQLAGIVKDLFAWELTERDGSADPAKDRLLFQLARAGVKVDGKTSTAELLELGTVAIASASRRPRRRPWFLPAVLSGAGMLLAAGVVFAYLFMRPGPHSPGPDAGREPQFSAYEDTDHLAPASLRAGQNGVGPASQPVGEGSGSGSAASKDLVRPRQPAFLNCNSWPWSLVYVNGRRLRGNTPFFRIKVPAGRHRIRFENPELGLSREVTVQVEPGDEKTVAVSLQQ